MANIFCWIEEKWGGVGAYLHDGIGFSYTEQKKLRRVLSRKKSGSARTRKTRYDRQSNDARSSTPANATMRPTSRNSQRERRTSRQSATLREGVRRGPQTVDAPPLPQRPRYDGAYSPHNNNPHTAQQLPQQQQQSLPTGPPPPVPKRPASVYGGNTVDQLTSLPPVPNRPVFPQQQMQYPTLQQPQQGNYLLSDCGLSDTAIAKTVFISDILRDTTHAQLILFFKFCGNISLLSIDR